MTEACHLLTESRISSVTADSISRQEIHEALGDLYDGVALARGALASRLVASVPGASSATCSQEVRALLLDAIDQMRPSRPSAFRSSASRSYQVMIMRFVEGLTMAEIAEELCISERQAYRDLWHAEEDLADLLNELPVDTVRRQSGLTHSEPSPLQKELAGISEQAAPIEVLSLLEAVVETVISLANRLGIEIAYPSSCSAISAYGRPTLLRQTLVQVLSAALRNAADQRVSLSTAAVVERVTISVSFRAREEMDARTTLASLEPLIRAQHIALGTETTREGLSCISITLSRRRHHTVLVLEDNPSAVGLYSRYLDGSEEWELVASDDPTRAFEVARDMSPAVIVLDILMPVLDGWQVLQHLRTQPETHLIPVLVCSVFDEQDLALALGATAYLKKPFSRSQFLSSLHDCLVRKRTWVAPSSG